LKLNAALFGNRSLLDRHHLPLHLRELGRSLLITADKESRRTEDYDRRLKSPSHLSCVGYLARRTAWPPWSKYFEPRGTFEDTVIDLSAARARLRSPPPTMSH
jgi:hypothetical protein